MIIPILHPYLHTFLPRLFQRLWLQLALLEELVICTDIHQDLGFIRKLWKKRGRVVGEPGRGGGEIVAECIDTPWNGGGVARCSSR